MKVVLLADVKGTGKKNDIVEVSDGFARNMLFKKKLAVEATSTEVNAVTNKKKAEEFHKAEEIKKWREQAAKIKNREVVCAVKCGESGKIFGSITSKEIAEYLFISENTVEAHRKNLFFKLKARNIADLIVKAISRGYINPSEI